MAQERADLLENIQRETKKAVPNFYVLPKFRKRSLIMQLYLKRDRYRCSHSAVREGTLKFPQTPTGIFISETVRIKKSQIKQSSTTSITKFISFV